MWVRDWRHLKAPRKGIFNGEGLGQFRSHIWGEEEGMDLGEEWGSLNWGPQVLTLGHIHLCPWFSELPL